MKEELFPFEEDEFDFEEEEKSQLDDECSTGYYGPGISGSSGAVGVTTDIDREIVRRILEQANEIDYIRTPHTINRNTDPI